MPIFSVIIPVYNGSKTIAATLECLARQTFKDFEIIIVNDGSTDNSETIIHDFERNAPSLTVKYVSQANKGLGGARNTALRLADGLYCSLIDQDDIWYPEKLEQVEQAFRERPDVSFVSHHVKWRIQGKVDRVLRSGPVKEDLFSQLLFIGNYFGCCATSFRREVISHIGYFSEDRDSLHFVEDYDYWVRAAKAGLKFFVLNELLGEYVTHEHNFSVKYKMMMLRHEWNVVQKHYADRPARHYSDFVRLLGRRGILLARQMKCLVET